ncbi:phosphatase PAP2 family protein [Halomicroarcula sp. F13]|uniref:Phosphatase PAP2 family protein n=1 Tax=Haloarcula rubra TaxID=2487747 RepID=A0AAW4PNF6_9EURY|nr:phosphatase PAP2 family protein [Halomicroarcula rubra]MBX0322690.1 phosphatase PAP2 family protein [Halomicroarcula rubra]
MSRAVGLTDLLSALPGVVVVAFALVTQLGDFWFVASACLLAYWVGAQTPRLGRGLTRDRAARLLGLLSCAVALAVGLKLVFALPRPPGAGTAPNAQLVPTALRGVYEAMATGDGYGFPSGHATTGVLVWGGFAATLRVGTRRARYAVAATVATLIALSRLVIGVHYLVDVVAGAAIALTVLWVALTRLRRPERVFALAAAAALVGVAAGGLTRDVAAGLGLAAGGALAWPLLPTVPEPTRRGATVTVVLGALSIAVLAVGIGAAESMPPVVGLLAGTGMALTLALPLVGERVAEKI